MCDVNDTIVCSGNGDCINSLCICHPGWTGKGDVYTLDGKDCHTLLISVQIMWCCTLAVILRNYYLHFGVFKKQLNKYRVAKERMSKRGQKFRIWKYHSMKSILPSLFVGQPLLISCCIVKIVIPDIGYAVHLPFTVVFQIAINISIHLLSTANKNNLLTFITQVNPLPREQCQVQRILNHSTQGKNWYIVVITIAVISSCIIFDGHSQYRLVVLLIRNIMVLAYIYTQLYVVAKLKKEALAFGQFLHTMDSDILRRQHHKLEQFCEKIDSHTKHMRNRATFVTITYSLFSIPVMWPYQTFPLAVMLIMMNGKAHHINVYLESSSSRIIPTTASRSLQPRHDVRLGSIQEGNKYICDSHTVDDGDITALNAVHEDVEKSLSKVDQVDEISDANESQHIETEHIT